MSGGIYLIFTLLIASPCLLRSVSAVNHGVAPGLPDDSSSDAIFKLRSEWTMFAQTKVQPEI